MKPFAYKPTRNAVGVLALLLTAAMLAGCVSVGTRAENSPSQAGDKYQDAREQSTLKTTGVESSDLHTACSKAVGALLACPLLASQEEPPHLAIDKDWFMDDTHNGVNTQVLVDLLRHELLDAASDRVVLVGREYAALVEGERELREQGVRLDELDEKDPAAMAAAAPAVPGQPRMMAQEEPERGMKAGPGTTLATSRVLGVDYFVAGRITDLSKGDLDRTECYTQIAIEAVDAKTSEIVFSDVYYFKKTSEAAGRWY